MTQDQITPWSQLDDELDECEDTTASSTEEPGRGRPGSLAHGDVDSVPWPSGPASASRRWWQSMNVAPHWALAPLALAAAWLAWGAISSAGGGAVISAWHALGILALILAAGAMLLIALIIRRNALADVYRAISQNTARTREVFDNLPIADELRPLWEAVEQHAESIEKQVAALVEEHKQLGLGLSLANAQKCRAEAVIHSIPEPLLVTDAFDQLVFANAAAEILFGFKLSDMLRRPITDVVQDQKLVRMIRQAREADSRAANRRAEHKIASRIYALTMSPFASGAQAGATSPENHSIVMLMRDVTKEQEATRNKSEFVARAAHELRAPLSSIRAYVEMLMEGEAGDEKTQEEYYNIIQSSADRLGRMIDNMLNISRIEAGTVRINREAVAISLIVKEVTDMVRPQAEEKEITLTEDLTPVAYRIMADKDMIYQAVLNLLSNAIKYTPDGGKVHVCMTPHEENSTIGIEVSDTGVGIPKEDLPRMFEKFFRVEANKKMAKGTGLGLNLVKHIVETIHEGKVKLSSKVGEGSTFGMVLPLMK
jgi:two-component system phosphate regulon sensor histidine kinase PhoR